MAVIDRWSGRSETVPYGVFDDLGVFVGRAYMPADRVPASAAVGWDGPFPGSDVAAGASPRPTDAEDDISASVGSPLGVTVAVDGRWSGRLETVPYGVFDDHIPS